MYVIATIIVFKHFNITLCYYIFTLLRMSESNTHAQDVLFFCAIKKQHRYRVPIMAVAARQVHVAKGEDHVVAVQTDTIYDPKSGAAVQVEKIAIAVDLGDGKVAMRQQERIIGVVVDAPPKVVSRPKAAVTKF